MQGSANLNLMIKTARKAGRALVKDFREVENLQVSSKGPGDFVTRADREAERIIKEGGDNTEDRIRWAWRQALLRKPDAKELATLRDLVKKHAAEYAADRAAAEALLKVGLKPVPAELDAAELATWTSVARVILNLHETITRS